MVSPQGQSCAGRVALLVGLAGFGAVGLGASGAVAVSDGGGALIVVGLVVGLTALITWRLFARRARVLGRLMNAPGVARWTDPEGGLVCLSEEGVLYQDELHTWGQATARIEGATFDPAAHRVVLDYSELGGKPVHRIRRHLEVPVPPAQDGEVAALVARLAPRA